MRSINYQREEKLTKRMLAVGFIISDECYKIQAEIPCFTAYYTQRTQHIEKVVLKSHGSIYYDDIAKKSRARIEEALAIINSSADELSDDEYNMLLIFVLLCSLA